MTKNLSVEEYFQYPETLLPQELIFGVLREPPAPRYGHQSVVTRVLVLLDQHVRGRRLGQVCVSPIDVVLDEVKDLVVQPDVIFVSTARLDIIRERVFGAPDLVVEVLSPSTAAYDRTQKLLWYREYGVSECWLIDPVQLSMSIVRCDEASLPTTRYRDNDVPRSTVLPAFDVPVSTFFA